MMVRQSKILRPISEEEYLKGERDAEFRSEYVDGSVFAMTGASDPHNLICGNLFAVIHGFLRGTPCCAYMNDMKVGIQSRKRYYYPDIMVSCEPVESDCEFKTKPVLIVEVLSPSTAQIDRREKLIAYQSIEQLSEYVVVNQNKQRIELYRRDSDKWEMTILTGTEVLVLNSLPNGVLEIPFSVIYERCTPTGRVKEEELDYEIESCR